MRYLDVEFSITLYHFIHHKIPFYLLVLVNEQIQEYFTFIHE